jgi:hypothetical protein
LHDELNNKKLEQKNLQQSVSEIWLCIVRHLN